MRKPIRNLSNPWQMVNVTRRHIAEVFLWLQKSLTLFRISALSAIIINAWTTTTKGILRENKKICKLKSLVVWGSYLRLHFRIPVKLWKNIGASMFPQEGLGVCVSLKLCRSLWQSWQRSTAGFSYGRSGFIKFCQVWIPPKQMWLEIV